MTIDKKREYMRRWRAENVEKRRASRNAWAKNNPDKLNGQRRRLRAKYKTKIQAYSKLYAEKNAEKLKVKRRELYLKNREWRIAYSRKYRSEHLAQTKARQKARLQERLITDPGLKQRMAEVGQRWKHANREKVNTAARESARRHASRITALRRERRLANPEKHAIHLIKRRQWKKERRVNGGDDLRETERVKRQPKLAQINAYNRRRYHSDPVWREHVLEYGKKRRKAQKFIRGEMPVVLMKWFDIEGTCYICGEQVRYAEISVDHVWPVDKGGEDHVANLMPVHGRCNSIKGKRLQFTIARPDLLGLCCGSAVAA